MIYQNLAIVGVFALLYSAISGRLEQTPISGAIVFTAFGLVVGPIGLGVLNPSVDADILRLLAELTLALVLFTDAAKAEFSVLKRSFHLPGRLLMFGLPLIILLGFGIGVLLFPELALLEIAILATMLAPTDAALGKAVVSDKSVRAEVRQGLNVESGLNDGICVPILFVFLALATASGGEHGAGLLALELLAEEIGIGIVVCVVLTYPAVKLFEWTVERGWVTESWRQLTVVTLAVCCFAGAQSLGGSGFIASFVGGLLFGWLTRHRKTHELLVASEATGDTLALVTWVVFGATVIGQAVGSFTWQVVLYAVLSLTVIRMLPVFLVLTGLPLQADEKLFVGWFGPRGLASVVFIVIVLGANLPGSGTLAATVACTVVLSILGHGLSANPLVALLARKHGTAKVAAD